MSCQLNDRVGKPRTGSSPVRGMERIKSTPKMRNVKSRAKKTTWVGGQRDGFGARLAGGLGGEGFAAGVGGLRLRAMLGRLMENSKGTVRLLRTGWKSTLYASVLGPRLRIIKIYIEARQSPGIRVVSTDYLFTI